jgi:hypothetical protein
MMSNGIVPSEMFQSDALNVCGTVSWMFSLCLGQHDKTVRSEFSLTMESYRGDSSRKRQQKGLMDALVSSRLIS